MAFKKAINIHTLSDEQIKTLKPGQWVYASDKEDKGVFCGVRESGTVVVAWYKNAKGYPSYNEYLQVMMGYAQGVNKGAGKLSKNKAKE